VKVLVTGAGGTLGALVTAQLIAAGRQVRAHDRVPLGNCRASEAIVGDLGDRDHVAELVEGVDAVVHAAANPSPLGDTEERIFANNVDSAYHVLDAAGRAKVGRIVYISSASALGLAWSKRGAAPVSVPVTEEHPYLGDDVYGLTKQIGEAVAATTSRRWDVATVALRFPFLGSGERLQRHLRPIREDPGVDRGGLWGWLDTRDAARAVLAALSVPLSGYHLVNVTAPDTSSAMPTRELLARYHPDTVVERELGEFETLFSIDRSRELLGFTAKHGWRNA
jgi:nucleoside-diphosphate-sugar epimerase